MEFERMNQMADGFLVTKQGDASINRRRVFLTQTARLVAGVGQRQSTLKAGWMVSRQGIGAGLAKVAARAACVPA